MSESTLPQQRVSDAEAAATAYFAAWNAHDGAAVAALVDGTYVDPTLPGPISGEELAGNVAALVAAFPDLQFVHESTHVDGHVVVGRWRMQGTNDGAALPGAPAPTGGTVDLPGIDVITTVGGRVQTVVGYFDRQTFLEQLGLQVLPAPKDEWPVTTGIARRVDLGNTTLPGALSMTWIELRDISQLAELGDRTQDIITSLAADPSFIGFDSMIFGTRAYTLTAWTSPEAAESALGRNRAHVEAMDRMMQERGIGVGGFTSIWQPYRLNGQFAECPSCKEYLSFTDGADTATCACGAEVQATPYI
jgi:steroid delta-isomerase-like uncharacterized protein